MSGSSSSSCGTYATRSDVERIFGKVNVSKWADLDNDGEGVDARIDWAIAEAENEINNELRNGPYDIPFCSPIDREITTLTAKRAGAILYDGRGITDADEGNDQLRVHRVYVDRRIRRILNGQVRLNHAEKAKYYPRSIETS